MYLCAGVSVRGGVLKGEGAKDWSILKMCACLSPVPQDLDDVIAQVESKSRSREEARLAQAATSDTGKSLTEIMVAGGEKSFKIKVGTAATNACQAWPQR